MNVFSLNSEKFYVSYTNSINSLQQIIINHKRVE